MLGVPKDRQVHIMLLLNTWWMIDSKPTICSSLQGFQQVRRSHDWIILTLASVARLVVQVNGKYYFFFFILCETPLSIWQVIRIVKSH